MDAKTQNTTTYSDAVSDATSDATDEMMRDRRTTT